MKDDYNKYMTKINVHTAKAQLSHFLKLAQNGETFMIYNRNTPMAELIPPRLKKKRELGLGRKRYPNWEPDVSALLEPMSEEELKLWYDGPIFPEK